jgi:hypothetical protein
MGMLSYFVHIHLEANLMTPTYILLLFIVSVLALAWAVFTLFSYHRSSANAQFVALIDLAFVGGLIAGVYYLRFIARADCASLQIGAQSVVFDFGALGSARVGIFDVTVNKSCGMLKGCFALAIMNCVFFFVTAVMAWVHGNSQAKSERKYAESRRRSRSRGHSHSRHRSRSGGHRGGSRSRRSSHSHSRAYV